MRSEGLEPPTYKFVACCSIQLSYDRMCHEATNEVTTWFFCSLLAKVALHETPRKNEALSEAPEGEGFEPSDRFKTVGHLANDWFQPLTHPSVGGAPIS